MRPILTAAVAILVGAASSPASAECTCRARDSIRALLGETVCIPTSSGPRLARCDQVLNNTSWTFLEAPCPQAMLDRLTNTQTARSSVAVPRKIPAVQ
jgi:hypothetical protein